MELLFVVLVFHPHLLLLLLQPVCQVRGQHVLEVDGCMLQLSTLQKAGRCAGIWA